MLDNNSQTHLPNCRQHSDIPDYHRPSDIQPEELISFISLPHYELHKLINDPQNFIKKVTKLNNQAKSKIQKALFKEALLLLNQAQKILQYAAGSGKNIDRDLIICVLHNLSCSYRNLWIIPKCSTYIEGFLFIIPALIFNLDNQITSLQSSISSAQINENSYEKTSAYQIKKSLTLYQLKFLATNSQLKQHQIALNSGKKALLTLKDIFTENQVYIKRLMKQEYEIVYQNTLKHLVPLDKKQYDNLIATRYNLLTQIFTFSDNIEIKTYKNIIKAAHFSYQIFGKEKYLGQDHPFSSFFKKYSIGDVMELKPLSFPRKKDTQETRKNNNDRTFQTECPEQSLFYKFILLSITLFSLGTEIRMLLNEEKELSSLAKQNDQRYRQSDILHLLAIITITLFVPFETLYFKHLLNSYKLHYSSDFFDYKTVQNQTVPKIIFLISGKKYEKAQISYPLSDNQYHLKEKLYDKLKTQKQIHTVRKIKQIHSKSKQNKKSFKTISFLQNKSTVIEKDYPTTTGSKSKSSEKTSKNKSKSKLNKKSRDISSTANRQQIKKTLFNKKITEKKLKQQNQKQQKSRSKSKKKSLSRYEEKYKSGSNSSSNKETYFLSKEIGLSSILQNGTKSKVDKDKEKQTVKNDFGTGYVGNTALNLRKIKSTKNLKDFISTAYSKSNPKKRQKSQEQNSLTSAKKM